MRALAFDRAGIGKNGGANHRVSATRDNSQRVKEGIWNYLLLVWRAVLFTPYQFLQAATVEPARHLGDEGKFGTIVEGDSADLVLLDKNPLEDITNARTINGVMVRGQWWSKDKINKELRALQTEYVEDRETMRASPPIFN